MLRETARRLEADRWQDDFHKWVVLEAFLLHFSLAMREFLGNRKDLNDQLAVLLDVLRAHVQANLIPPMVFSFDASILQLL